MPFETLIQDARNFLTELDQNNNRDWFLDNKDRYDTALKAPALVLLDVVAADLQRQTGKPVSSKLFRQQRDVRFSKDKTPYKPHLHMLWECGEGLGKTAFFFGVEINRNVLGGGCMGMDKDKLAAFRKRVDGPKGADLIRALNELEGRGLRLSEPELKRVPAPFGADHPRGDLLRRKSLTVWQDMPTELPHLQKTLRNGFAGLKPVLDWLMALK